MNRFAALGLALVAIWTFFATRSPVFLGARNLSMLAIELSITAVLALGMLLVLLPGQIDLSVGSGVGLCGGIASVLVFRHAWPAPIAMVLAAAATITISAAMGSLIVRAKLPAFIVTLAGLLVLKGLFWSTIDNATVPVGADNAFAALTTYFFPRWIGVMIVAVSVITYTVLRIRAWQRRRARGLPVVDRERLSLELFVVAQAAALLTLVLDRFRGLPLSLVILAVSAVVIHVITTQLPLGRHVYAIGDNEAAARLSGVSVHKTMVIAYALLGAVVAITGLMQTAYSGAATTTVGDLMELDAIAACVVGGTSLRGGRGSVPGVLFGALIMASLLNGMTLLAVAPELKLMARGTVLLVAVWLDVAVARRLAA